MSAFVEQAKEIAKTAGISTICTEKRRQIIPRRFSEKGNAEPKSTNETAIQRFIREVCYETLDFAILI